MTTGALLGTEARLASRTDVTSDLASPCPPHHWLLPPAGYHPAGKVYDGCGVGVCKRCGAERMFILYYQDLRDKRQALDGPSGERTVLPSQPQLKPTKRSHQRTKAPESHCADCGTAIDRYAKRCRACHLAYTRSEEGRAKTRLATISALQERAKSKNKEGAKT